MLHGVDVLNVAFYVRVFFLSFFSTTATLSLSKRVFALRKRFVVDEEIDSDACVGTSGEVTILSSWMLDLVNSGCSM